MLSLLSRRRARIKRIDAEAEVLISDFCDEAYSEALRRERDASSDEIAKDWNRVAIEVAHKMAKGIGIDPSTRIAMNALFVPDRKPAAVRLPRVFPKPRRLDDPKRVLSSRSQLFRIQFVGSTPDRETTILKEVKVWVADTSAAIVAAANTAWPPRTIGLRIFDREGREVFVRQKAKR